MSKRRDRTLCTHYAIAEFTHNDNLPFSDIDECKNEALFNCTKNSSCVNLEGNYTCNCDSGYTQDGDLCIGRNLVNCDGNSMESVV